MSEQLSPGLIAKLLDLQEYSSSEYLISLWQQDRDKAIKYGKELILFSCLEELSDSGPWLEIVRDELVAAAFDFDIPERTLEEVRLYVADGTELSNLPRISSASVRPSGTYDIEEVVEGFAEGDLYIAA